MTFCCQSCRSRRYWINLGGNPVCAACHPPVHPMFEIKEG